MTSRDQSALILFSGGQDSATCLAWALERYSHVETIGFDYGQTHAVELTARITVREMISALKPDWGAKLGQDHMVDLRGYGAIADSALTKNTAIEYDARGLPTTFVPGRNLVFLSVASAVADRRGAGVLIGGMCETDYSGYPDCRRDTLDAMQTALSPGLDRDLSIKTPLMDLTKAQTWGLANTLGGDELVGIIREHTRTCYRGQEDAHDWGYGCGSCPACELRAKGWAEYVDGL